MAKEQSGVLQGTPWSSDESKPDLYQFARELELPGVNSRTSKPDIVKALVKAQRAQDKVEVKPEAKAPTPRRAPAPKPSAAPKPAAKKPAAKKPAAKKPAAKPRARVAPRPAPAPRNLAAEARAKKAARKARRAQGGRGRG